MARPSSSDYIQTCKYSCRVISGPVDLNEGPRNTGFNSITMPDYSTDAAEYKEGHWKTKRKQPGTFDVSGDVTLSRGMTLYRSAFHNWFDAHRSGADYRADLVVRVMHSTVNTEIYEGADGANDAQHITIRLNEGFIIRWKPMPDLDATSTEIALGEIDVSIESFDITYRAGPLA